MHFSDTVVAAPAKDLYGKRIPSPRQQQVIELVAQGLKNSDVAVLIGTTENVVKNYLRVIYDKLGCWNRVELALWYEARRHEGAIFDNPLGDNSGSTYPQSNND